MSTSLLKYLDHGIKCLRVFQLGHGLISGWHFDASIVFLSHGMSVLDAVFVCLKWIVGASKTMVEQKLSS